LLLVQVVLEHLVLPAEITARPPTLFLLEPVMLKLAVVAVAGTTVPQEALGLVALEAVAGAVLMNTQAHPAEQRPSEMSCGQFIHKRR
jgi:hypothetical protein